MPGINSMEKAKSCPKCGSLELGRSHRKNPLEVAASAFVLPWRCRVCYARFFKPRSFQPAPLVADERTVRTVEEAPLAETPTDRTTAANA